MQTWIFFFLSCSDYVLLYRPPAACCLKSTQVFKNRGQSWSCTKSLHQLPQSSVVGYVVCVYRESAMTFRPCERQHKHSMLSWDTPFIYDNRTKSQSVPVIHTHTQTPLFRNYITWSAITHRLVLYQHTAVRLYTAQAEMTRWFYQCSVFSCDWLNCVFHTTISTVQLSNNLRSTNTYGVSMLYWQITAKTPQWLIRLLH